MRIEKTGSKLEEEFKSCNSLEIVLKKHLLQSHLDFATQGIRYPVSTIELFITDTIKSAYGKPRVLC